MQVEALEIFFRSQKKKIRLDRVVGLLTEKDSIFSLHIVCVQPTMKKENVDFWEEICHEASVVNRAKAVRKMCQRVLLDQDETFNTPP